MPSGPVKLDAVADQITTHWHQTRDNTYLDETTGEPSPVRGGLQLVFSDLGTPNETRWDAYTELKIKLVEAGMPPDAVRFIHEAKNDQAKARLFASARAGHVAVLIGSTAKMGVGTNVQNRLTALHHIDCPWRPADLEQRDGRGIRQGNQNPEVALTRYVVERSFDAYSWQTVGRKATFIAQVMSGRLDAREVEDIGDTALSAAEAKALASGNPLILEKATADQEFQKLHRQETAHGRSQSALRHTQHTAEQTVERATEVLAQLRPAQERTTDTTEDKFAMRIGQRTFTSRGDAAAALTAWVDDQRHTIRATGRDEKPLTVRQIAGHEILAHGDHLTSARGPEPAVFLSLAGVPGSSSASPLAELASEPNFGAIRALENKPLAIPRRIATTEQDLTQAHQTLKDVAARLGKPFPHAEDLQRAGQRVREINQQLADLSEKNTASPTDPDPDETPNPTRHGPGAAEADQAPGAGSPGAAAQRRLPPGGASGAPGRGLGR